MTRLQNPFDKAPEQYDAWFDSEEGEAIFVVELACLQSVMPTASGRWLEVGVGTGRFAAALGIAEGIDPSASMRALAEGRGVRTLDAVGEHLPFAERDFDGVLVTTTLCFLRDPEASLQECYRILKDTGRLIVGMIPADSPWGALYKDKAAAGHPVYSAATFHTCDEVAKLAASVGFDFAAAASCLFTPPGSPALDAPPREGIIEGAGFTAMAFVKPVSRALLNGRAE